MYFYTPLDPPQVVTEFLENKLGKNLWCVLWHESTLLIIYALEVTEL